MPKSSRNNLFFPELLASDCNTYWVKTTVYRRGYILQDVTQTISCQPAGPLQALAYCVLSSWCCEHLNTPSRMSSEKVYIRCVNKTTKSAHYTHITFFFFFWLFYSSFSELCSTLRDDSGPWKKKIWNIAKRNKRSEWSFCCSRPGRWAPNGVHGQSPWLGSRGQHPPKLLGLAILEPKKRPSAYPNVVIKLQCFWHNYLTIWHRAIQYYYRIHKFLFTDWSNYIIWHWIIWPIINHYTLWGVRGTII